MGKEVDTNLERNNTCCVKYDIICTSAAIQSDKPRDGSHCSQQCNNHGMICTSQLGAQTKQMVTAAVVAGVVDPRTNRTGRDQLLLLMLYLCALYLQ